MAEIKDNSGYWASQVSQKLSGMGATAGAVTMEPEGYTVRFLDKENGAIYKMTVKAERLEA